MELENSELLEKKKFRLLIWQQGIKIFYYKTSKLCPELLESINLLSIFSLWQSHLSYSNNSCQVSILQVNTTQKKKNLPKNSKSSSLRLKKPNAQNYTILSTAKAFIPLPSRLIRSYHFIMYISTHVFLRVNFRTFYHHRRHHIKELRRHVTSHQHVGCRFTIHIHMYIHSYFLLLFFYFISFSLDTHTHKHTHKTIYTDVKHSLWNRFGYGNASRYFRGKII